MSLHAVKILGINVTISPKKEILEYLRKYITQTTKNKEQRTKNSAKSLRIVTPNPEQVVLAKRDSHFAQLLNQADVALPDGVGIVWALRFLFYELRTRIHDPIAGVDFMENLVSIAAKQRVPIALIGGRGELAVKTLDCLQKKHPDLVGIGFSAPKFDVVDEKLYLVNHESGIRNHVKEQSIHNSQFSIQYSNEAEYFKALAQRIIDSGVGMVFVGLGAPKQELFIEQLVHSLSFIVHRNTSKNHDQGTMNPIILMSVGGSFDEISGRLPRPPQMLVNLRLKWLWRLILEPWRIRRQLALLEFVWLVFKEKKRALFQS